MIATEKETEKGKTRAQSRGSAKLVMFDLDGTLAESKSPLDEEMAGLICKLLALTKVAVISGASFAQFQSQFLHFLPCDESQLADLLILPTVGAAFYRYEKGEWELVYEKKLTPEDEKLIQDDIKKALAVAASQGIAMSEKIYGEQIEDRGSQVTFSALGQGAPLGEKAKWDPDHVKRQAIVNALLPLLPDFEIEIGGMTSIDITKKGMNKEYGITAAAEYLGISKDDILYVGDSLFPGGNDYGAIKVGVRTFAVRDVADTKKFIRDYLGN